MTEPMVIQPAGGEIIGDAPDRRVEVLSDHDSLHATWSRFGAGRDGADLHIHHRHTDLFYVLGGELTVMLGPDGDEHRIPAGTLARVPPLVVHGFRNASDADVKYLNLHAPGEGFIGFMRGLRDGTGEDFDQDEPPADGGRPASEATIGERLVELGAPELGAALICDIDAVAIAEAWGDSQMPSPPLHVHRRHVESYYVVEGAVEFTVGDESAAAEAGTWLQVPVGVAHTFAFAGDKPTRLLTIHTPASGFGDLIRGIAAGETDPAAASGFDQENVEG